MITGMAGWEDVMTCLQKIKERKQLSMNLAKIKKFFKKNRYEKRLAIVRNTYTFVHHHEFGQIGKGSYSSVRYPLHVFRKKSGILAARKD